MSEQKRFPYPGLRPFERDESDIFFGRDPSIITMVDRLAANRFLAVLGSSGSGKSSLVRTGLQDALFSGLHPAGNLWKVVDFHPGGQPYENLAAALAKSGSDLTPIDADLLRQGPLSVVKWAQSGNLQDGWNLLLLADQFEELFRYKDYDDLEQAEAFSALLLESSSAASVPIYVVITMRSEFLGACASIPKLAERVGAGLYLTPRMSRKGCQQAIEGPARVLGFEVESALVNRTLNDLATFAPWDKLEGAMQLERLSRQADQLPLMQHVLNRLWVRANELNRETGDTKVVLRLSDYEEMGGLTGAIQKHGEEILRKLGGLKDYVPPIFCALVEGTQEATALRRRCTIGELAQVAGCSREDVILILAEFEGKACNFVRKDFWERKDNFNEYIVDLSHESLIRQWPQLGKWLATEANDAREWRRLVEAQERYTQENRTGGLLSGPDLENLEEWWFKRKPSLAWTRRYGGDFEKTKSFLEESRKAARESDETEAKLWSANINLPIFQELFDLLLSDTNVSLMGLSKLQAELLERLDRYASTINEKLSGSGPADRIRIEYRLGIAYEETGAASTALQRYSQGYADGLAAIGSSQCKGEALNSLCAAVLEVGIAYAWFLLDVGRTEEATTALGRLKELAGTYDAVSTPKELRLPFANLENLLNRAQDDPNNRNDEHVSLALELLAPIAAEEDASMNVLSLQSTLYSNLFPPRHNEVLDEAEKLADRMFRKNPSDTRATRALVVVKRARAQVAKDDKRLDVAEDYLQQARSLLGGILHFVPENYRSMLLLAEVEADLAGISEARHNAEQRKQHMLAAHEQFVRAFSGRTWFPSRFWITRQLYDGIMGLQLPDAEMRTRCLEIVESLKTTLEEFPNARDFAFVCADAAVRLSEELKKIPEKEAEQEEYLSKAITWFDQSRIITEASRSTYDIYNYARALESRASLYAALGRHEEMLADLARVHELFEPILKTVPWDMWLRKVLRDCEQTAGQALLKSGKYEEALSHLEYGSKWGSRISSTLLAEMYREGKGVDKNQQKSEELEALAQRQTWVSFSIPASVGDVPRIEKITVFEWSSDYPYMGIDDQVEYFLKGTGITIGQEVAACFRVIHELARKYDISFPSLVHSILNRARGDATSTGLDASAALQPEELDQILSSLNECDVLAANAREPVAQPAPDLSVWGSEVEIAAARGQTEQVRKLIAAGATPPGIWLKPPVSEVAGFLSFTEVSPDEAEFLNPKIAELGPDVIIGIEGRRLRRASLSFFPDYNILAIQDPAIPGQNEQFALERPDSKLTLMNWTNEPIYQAAESCEPKFDNESVILYCRFFFHWVRGQIGRFKLTEPLDRVDWTDDAAEDVRKKVIDRLRYLRVVERLEDRVRLRGTVIFKNALFETDILVATRETDIFDPASRQLEHLTLGQTKLMNEELVLENLPIEIDRPAGIFG